jgi:hypothetical protein
MSLLSRCRLLLVSALALGLAVYGSGCGEASVSGDVGLHVGATCTADADCGDFCDPDGVCAELVATGGSGTDYIDCATDDDCDLSSLCDPVLLECYYAVPTDDIGDECNDDIDCLADEICTSDGVSNFCAAADFAPVGCEVDDSCAVGDECFDDIDCDVDGDYCDAGVCAAAPDVGGNECIDDADCAGALVCNPDYGFCE